MFFALVYLRVRDCCECFVYKYTHELNMYNERKILYTARGRRGRVQYTKFFVHCTYSARACICKQNTNLTVSNTFNM